MIAWAARAARAARVAKDTRTMIAQMACQQAGCFKFWFDPWLSLARGARGAIDTGAY